MSPALPDRIEFDGNFPFGRPNGPRPTRMAAGGPVRQVVIGTYPSALHVDWTAPRFAVLPPRAKGRVGAFAVDVEPAAFWDGADAHDRIRRWAAAVGFREGDEPGCHGHIKDANNGPSGSGLRSEYFPALPFTFEQSALLDVYPVYFVKQGTKRANGARGKRGQSEAIADEYNAIVDQLEGFSPATLPNRPTAKRLPHMAIDRFGDWLRETLEELQPAHVVTLGEEAWNTLAGIEGIELDHPCVSLSASRIEGYGRTSTMTVSGRTIAWTPLAHPGLIRMSSEDPGSWGAVHRRWLRSGPR